MSSVIKNNDDVIVTLEEHKGYVIRLHGKHGATFTIDEDLNVIIGESSRMTYSDKTWNLLNREISDGKDYMRALKENDEQHPSIKPVYISTKNIKPNTFYENEKCQIIFFIGAGRFRDGLGNRSGCKHLTAKFAANSVLNYYQDGDAIIVQYDRHKTYCDVDHYVTKPTKLVKELASFPINIDHIKMVDENGNVTHDFYIKRS